MEIVLPVILVAVAAAAVWAYAAAIRRDHLRIRRWADQKGYAVLSIQRTLTRMEVLPHGFGGRLLRRGSVRSYEVKVQDEEGGQFTMLVTVWGSKRVEARRL